jgi:hypothetical protein
MAAVVVADLPSPKMLPMGRYIWAITGIPAVTPAKSGTSENIMFRCRVVGVAEDFENPEDLEAFGDPVGVVRTLMFNRPDPDLFPADEKAKALDRMIATDKRITDFLVRYCGVDGQTYGELISGCANHQFIGNIKYEIDSRDPEKMQERLDPVGAVA